jgi:hypothetical protein
MPRPKKLPGVPTWEPWQAPAWEKPDAAALQALARGDADSGQQLRALKFIVETIAGTYDDSFRPGVDGARLSDYAMGKRYVGLQIVKLIKTNLGAFSDAPTEQG